MMREGILLDDLLSGTWETRSPTTKSNTRVAKPYEVLNGAGVTGVIRWRFGSYRWMICTIRRVDDATEPRDGPDTAEALVVKGWRRTNERYAWL
jgi:hypothetical protein